MLNGALMGYITSMGAFTGFDVLTAAVPIKDVVGAYCTFLIGRYFVMLPLFTGVRALIMWLLA
jgi:hypothetical protein